MTSGVPTYFQSISPVIASYDWLDITAGVGYRRYYACSSDIEGGVITYLSTRILDSSSGEWYKDANINVGAAAKVIDLDFDITMEVPAIIYGNAFINLTYAVQTGTNIDDVYSVIRIYHVAVGGAETQLGTAQTSNYTAAASPKYFRENVLVALTKKHFSRGEKLRLTVEIWAGDNTGGTMRLFYDPSSSKTYTDTSTRTIGTDLVFDVPFQVNL